MIMRSWRAQARGAQADAYARHLQDEVLPKLRQIDGYQGAYLLRRALEDGAAEIVVLTLWSSMEAIHRFAGPDAGRAVVEPAAQAVLEDYDRDVRHFDVLVGAG